MIQNLTSFIVELFNNLLFGPKKYRNWLLVLSFFMLLGFHFYCRQLASGLIVTGMSDQVSWGFYVSNFTFAVGLAAGAVMLVIPAYIYNKKSMHEIVIFGELMAIASIVMCLLFVLVDIGRPDRMLHMVPVIGLFNFPSSILTWDTIVLNVYFALNLYIVFYLVYMRFMGKKPQKKYYLPAVYISVVWAFSLHTVTAFLYNGLGAKPFWNSAIIAPRFLASACVAGPAAIFLTIKALKRFADIEFFFFENATGVLRNIITVSLSINVFFLLSEVFTAFYTQGIHMASVHYLFFGLDGHYAVAPFMWLSIILNTTALVILFIPKLHGNDKLFSTVCGLTITGIWLEKGMGFIVPGFIPTPLGEIVEYFPTITELFVSLGIVACGCMVFTLSAKAILPILREKENSHE
ncbi:MAG: polysulfide reductase NrfD [bacterium]|nr:polysulfide reductase NrfD [bacterium]